MVGSGTFLAGTVASLWDFRNRLCLDGIESLVTGVTDHRLPICGCWELNPSTLQGRHHLLDTELSLKSLGFLLRRIIKICGFMNRQRFLV